MVPRAIAPEESIRSCRVGIRPLILPFTMSRLSCDISRLRMISAKPNKPIATLVKPMPSDSSAMSKVMRPAPVSRSEPTIDNNRPVTIMAMALSTEPLARTTAKIRPSTISEKYSAGPNRSAIDVSGTPSAATSTVETQPAKNEPMAADRERRAGAALPRHLMAVEAGDDRGGFTRNIDQHRGGRAAILGAVINSGEHDQRADRRQAEGDRQQHGNRRDGADARKHTDQCADERAEQTKADVVWIGGDRETERKVGEKFTHDGLLLSTRAKAETAVAADRRIERRKRPSSPRRQSGFPPSAFRLSRRSRS